MIASILSGVALDRSSAARQVEQCLWRALDPAGEGARTFISTYDAMAPAVARSIDTLRAHGYALSPLAGMPVSIKDLLDVAGEVTHAGSRVLDDAAPAIADAPVVQRLKAAGAVLVGRTNMTPFAYSLVGLNEQFGTPGNPWDRTRIPGGSSSGAAVSVAQGMATAAIGSDTVGSIRVPAALCGVVGLKPTQRRVPLAGSIPLSNSLDTIGPLARTVEDCTSVLAVIAREERPVRRRQDVAVSRLVVPKGPCLEGLDRDVARAFDRATRLLARQGAVVVERQVEVLRRVQESDFTRVIQGAEAFAWHAGLLERRGPYYDPRIKARIETGRLVEATAYVAALGRRGELMAAFDAELADADALVLPTVPTIAPTFVEAREQEDAVRTRLLRNVAPFSFLDCCAVSLPIHEPGSAPVGLSVVGRRGDDWPLLDLAAAIEAALAFAEGD